VSFFIDLEIRVSIVPLAILCHFCVPHHFCFLTWIHAWFSHADTGILSLAPLKRVALGAHDAQPVFRPLPPYA
jgi:hypothetical protein